MRSSKQKIARTSAAPGKTRLANYLLIDNLIPNLKSLYLVDLPGYGYARGGAESVEAFECSRGNISIRPRAIRPPHRRRVSNLSIRGIPDLPQDAAGYAWLMRRAGADGDRRHENGQAEADRSRRRHVRTLERTAAVARAAESRHERHWLDEIVKLIRQWSGRYRFRFSI